tara:strand:+ start:8933 stop:11392 length:2460 start_codon:yes stop_codon:yes gene_type:complete
MAERIVSPGVFTREKDLSFLPQGISEIGAAIIGPTEKGPAFTPTQITSFQEFEEIFGNLDPRFYTPYAAEAYLKSAGVVTIVRVLGIGGYLADTIELRIQSSGSGYSEFTQSIAVLAPSLGSSGGGDLSKSKLVSSTSSATSFDLVVSGSNVTERTYSLSFDTGSSTHISKVFSSSPLSTKANGAAGEVYVYKNYKTRPFDVVGETGVALATMSASISVTDNGLDFKSGTNTVDDGGDASDTTWTGNKDFQFARTPYIQSQNLSGAREDLFRVYSRSHGTDVNSKFKIAILDIVRADDVAGSDFGTFAIQVRVHNPDGIDDDTILETFNKLTFDPLSPNFFARRIGDRYSVIDDNGKKTEYGTFPNVSKHIRVADFKNLVKDGQFKLDKALVPMGHGKLQNPTPGGTTVPTAVTQSNQLTTGGIYDQNIFYGFNFANEISRQYLAPIPSSATPGSNVTMSLEDQFGTDEATELGVSTFADATEQISLTNSALQQRKFIVPLQFGFDGKNPAIDSKTATDIVNTNTQGFDLSSTTASGSVAFKRAINTISNPDEVDINLLAIPGVIHGLHSTVTNHAISKMEARADAFYIMDAAGWSDTIETVKNTIVNLDTNYAAVYYPWVQVVDSSTDSPVWVPPSTVLPGVYSFNDSVAHEWFAPAGLTRGGLTDVLQANGKLTHAERDDLYEARINPIASFPNQNVVVFGQKTLQSKPSALDRINIRRLLIRLRKFIASSSRFLVFEQNTQATRNRFLNIVNPFLESVQSNSGLSAFRVVMDDSNNTPDVVDRNQLVGQIFIQPTRTAEFIVLDFVVQPTGASFPE